jgi:hypothetical protein
MALLAVGKVVRFQSELAQHVFRRDALATAPIEPDLSFVKTAAVFLGDRFLIVNHHFEQPYDRVELARVKLLDQSMSVLFVGSHGFLV